MGGIWSGCVDDTPSAAWTSTKPYRYARAAAEFLINPLPSNQINLTARRRVECGVDVPGAGHFSRREWSTSGHSAAVRAGTVIDGHNQQIDDKQPHRDHRGWSPHMTASRDKPAKPNQAPNGSFITSGEIGTNAMHPPGERSIGINKSHFRTDTRGRTRRSEDSI